MNKSKQFCPRLRENVVRLSREYCGEYPSLRSDVESSVPEVDWVQQPLLDWVEHYQSDGGMREGANSAQDFERLVGESCRANETLMRASAFLALAQCDRRISL
jgi:hypothetical protein